MRNIKNKNAFTLIELMVVIAIMGILLLFSYAPYNIYQTKAKLKLATREVAQSFYEAKNIAVSGLKLKTEENSFDNSQNKSDSSSIKEEFENKSVWIFLTSEESKNDVVNYYFFPYDKKVENIKLEDLEKPSKKKEIQKTIFLKWFSAWWNEFKSILVFYESVTWQIKVKWFNWDSQWTEIKEDVWKIKIKFSFKNSTTEFLQKEITYYLKTNIVDYK